MGHLLHGCGWAGDIAPSAFLTPESDELYALVGTFALAAGIALLASLVVEATGRIVLLIPTEIERLKEEGRKEGRMEQRQLGEREDGSIRMALTPETIKLLMGDDIK